MKERSGMPYDVVAFSTDENALMLSNAQEGVFHRLMRHAWINGSLPISEPALAAIAREPLEVFRELWKYPLENMWTTHPELADRLINPKQEEEREFKRLQSARQTRAAKKANKVRWSAHPKRIRDASETDTKGNPNGSPPSPPPSISPTEIYVPHGEFGRAKLTADQFEKLKAKLNGNLADYIARFDRWVNEAPDAKKDGVRRKDRHAYESISSWFDRDRKEGKLGRTRNPEKVVL